MDVVIKLISQTLTTDELGYPIASETFYETFAKVRSITQTEFFSVGKNGITPDFSFVVNDAEYHGQRLLEYEGKRYGIYRTYQPNNDTVELYAEYKSGVTDYVPKEVNGNGDNNQSGTASSDSPGNAVNDSSAS